MTLHLKLLSAAALAVVLTACPGRDDDKDPDAGCVGACGADAGTDAGDNTDAGETTDGGETGTCEPWESEYTKSCTGTDWNQQTKVASVEQVRYGECFKQKLKLENMVVVGIDDAYEESEGPRRNFWVAAKDDPSMGIIIHLRGSDTRIPADAEIKVGDVVNVTGFLATYQNYRDRSGRRFLLNNYFKSGAVVDPVVVEILSSGEAPAPIEIGTPACFGDAELGNKRPNPEHAGARIHIPGPVEITNASPTALDRDTTFEVGSPEWAGFEVTGGILISDYKTADVVDAEGAVITERCDWRKKAIAAAAEGKKIVFPNGITGVWDSYTHAPVVKGPITGCTSELCNEDGKVPGTTNFYTYVLYPQSCEDVVAEIVAQ